MRYGLCLLNYMFTSNHIHLIAYDNGDCGVIEQSMQLAQGRIAQEFRNSFSGPIARAPSGRIGIMPLPFNPIGIRGAACPTSI
ncbi:MAG: hypothetical protein ACP5I4_09770 [Oceanipulchritudo sp.]|jgi:hypothetical protein